MTNNKQNDDRNVRILRWLARGLGTLMASLWLFIVVMSIFTESTELDPESAIMAILIFSSVFGVIVAWFRELEGGIILLIIAIAHSTFAFIVSGHNRGLAMLISGGPFFVIGSLFIATWWRSRSSNSTANDV